MVASTLIGLLAALSVADAADEEAPAFPASSPYAVVVGGGAAELVDLREDGSDSRQGRVWTPALARVGMSARLSEEFSLLSEVELNAGPYGTSVWEGQAALQVRNQLIRYRHVGLFGEKDRIVAEVGRVTDPASFNFVSAHIANLLLSDSLARFPLLTSGFNRGNGVRAAYTVADRLTFGLTLNGGNPTSTTATVMVGGTFPPFGRFYEVPWSLVGRDARGFPGSTFHTFIYTPSVRYQSDVLQAQFAVQRFQADTNTNTDTDERITGTNIRGGLRLSPGKHFALFANGSRIVNDVVELDDLATLADAKYLGITTGGGFDVYVKGRSGFGAQYDLIREEQRGEDPTFLHYVNAGATLAVSDHVSLAGRAALYQRCEQSEDLEPCDADGLRQFMLTATAALGPSPQARP